MSENHASLKERIRHEVKNFLIVFAYAWSVLALLALHKAFILRGDLFFGQLLALINALIMAKVVVIFEFFHIGKAILPYRAAIRVIIRSIIFGLLLFLFHLIEEEIIGWFHGKTFSETLAEIDNGRLLELATLALIMIVVFVPYFLLREIAAAVGEKKLVAILF